MHVDVGNQSKPWENTLQQRKERERRALAESILQVGATQEVEVVPVAG